VNVLLIWDIGGHVTQTTCSLSWNLDHNSKQQNMKQYGFYVTLNWISSHHHMKEFTLDEESYSTHQQNYKQHWKIRIINNLL
jgi:hypothetical protein